MTAKEYLSQAYKLDKQADMIIQKVDALRKYRLHKYGLQKVKVKK